jgi:ELWxxDGT repeat protein
VTDGTNAGTTLISNIEAGSTSSDPRWLTPFGKGVFFAAGDTDRELWFASATGATRVADIRAGGAGSSPSHLARVGDCIYFSADDGSHGRELWVWKP